MALWVRGAKAAAFGPDWGEQPQSRTSEVVEVVVSLHGGNTRVVAQIKEFSSAHPYVQPLPQGRVLAVGARCKWTEQGPERDALIYDGTGDLVLEATLGDGIEHVRTTSTATVWVGYFDEGIFGNEGWGAPGPVPIGVSGIISFTGELEKAWEYPGPGNTYYGDLHDCYALNVDGDAVWACYYSDFPIVQIKGGAVRGWSNTVAGARALAVRSGEVWLAGGYGPERDRLTAGTLEADELVVHWTKRIVIPDGGELLHV